MTTEHDDARCEFEAAHDALALLTSAPLDDLRRTEASKGPIREAKYRLAAYIAKVPALEAENAALVAKAKRLTTAARALHKEAAPYIACNGTKPTKQCRALDLSCIPLCRAQNALLAALDAKEGK